MDVVVVFDTSRQVMKTDFALKLCPLVGGYIYVIFGNDFVLEPSLQTQKVDKNSANTGVEF